MPPMTKAQLESTIDEMIAKKVGSTLDERIKAFQAEQSSRFATMFAGQGNAAAARGSEEKGLEFGRAMVAVAAAHLTSKNGRNVSPADIAKARWGADAPVTKALAAGILQDGGALVPEQLSSDFIELLRPASAIRKLNPTIEPMDAGNLTIPKMTGGATATYVGENKNIPPSQPTFGTVRLSARKLAALVPMSNDLLRRTNGRADRVVRDDAVAAVAQRGDLAMIRGDGSQFVPRGLRYWVPAANIVTANATVNLANVVQDLGKLIALLGNANVKFLRPGWLLSYRSYVYLTTLLTTNGVFAFRDEMQNGTLWGWPYALTTQIPNNIGGTSVGSEVYLVDFADVVIGEATNVLIDVSSDAAYFDGTQVVAAFSLDQTVVRVIVEHDLVMRHEESIAMLDDARWT